MRTDHINGNHPVGPSAHQTNRTKSLNFNRILAETTASLSEKSLALRGRMEAPDSGSPPDPAAAKLVKIGTISSKNPTVSNLLIENPKLKKECWDIIYARQNEGKEYTRIRTGTDIYLNPDTKELFWGDVTQKTAAAPAVAGAPSQTDNPEMAGVARRPGHGNHGTHQATAGSGVQDDGLNEKLVKAVEPMIGKRYSDVNCYELLVNGLRKLGVRYRGRDGLGRKLIDMALGKGLPMNAYLTGEGLTQASGSKVYSKSFLRIDDPAGQTRQVIKEMAPLLEKGSILSFSLESRGHTGIVSSKNGAWTYINSGVMDNLVGGNTARKGVGEETLNAEIENWFQLAASRNESLVITLGKLNQNKLTAFGKNKDLTIS
jgi:hypothetical protein